MNCSFLLCCVPPLRIATASHDSTVRIWEKESRGKNKLKTGCLSLAISDSCQGKKIGCNFLFGCEKANCLGYALFTLSILLMANLASGNHEDSGAFWTFSDSLLRFFVVTECVATVDFSGCGPLTDICAWDDGRSVIVYSACYFTKKKRFFKTFSYKKLRENDS